MANINKPMGLSPARYLSAGPWTAGGNVYFIPSTDTNAYAIGDPVASLTGAADPNGVSAVTLATAGAGNRLRGVILSCGGLVEGGAYVNPLNLNSTVIPAIKTQGYYVLVMDDPMGLFFVQEWGGLGSTAFTSADIGKNVNLKAGSNNGFISGWTLDDTAASSTASTGQVRLMGIQRSPQNAIGQYCVYLVLINQHELLGPSAGV